MLNDWQLWQGFLLIESVDLKECGATNYVYVSKMSLEHTGINGIAKGCDPLLAGGIFCAAIIRRVMSRHGP